MAKSRKSRNGGVGKKPQKQTIVAESIPSGTGTLVGKESVRMSSTGTLIADERPRMSSTGTLIADGGKRKRRGGSEPQSDTDEIVRRLYDLIQSANDKQAVMLAVHAALYNNASMSSKPLPPSSKNAEIEEIIGEFEGDSDLSSEIDEKLKQQGARRRKTKKSKKVARKTRKYSRRR